MEVSCNGDHLRSLLEEKKSLFGRAMLGDHIMTCKTKSFKACVGLSMAGAMVMGVLMGQPAFASEEHEPVEARYQSTETIVLTKWLKRGDFMLLKDVTPIQIVGGHVAMKVPCNRDETTPLIVLAGTARHGVGETALVEVELEFIHDISNPGRDCVYHADLDIPHIQEELYDMTGEEQTPVTDIALKNDGPRTVWFGRDLGNTVTVNVLTAPSDDDHHDDGE